MDEKLSIALKEINKINGKLKSLYRKNINSYLRRFVDYFAMPRYSITSIMHDQLGTLNSKLGKLNKRSKSQLQILQNKCIRFCLNLNN